MYLKNKLIALSKEYGCTFLYTGGAVRNSLLNLDIKDVDIVIQYKDNILESFVKKLATDLKVNYNQYNRSGAYRITYKKIDYEFVQTTDFAIDEYERDFTMNALYSEELGSELYSKTLGKGAFYFSNDRGLKDIENGIISAMNSYIFTKDSLRMLRAIRFAAQLNFDIDEYTFNLIIANKEKINLVSQERITAELNKIILSKNSGYGLELLLQSGLLEIIIPELTRLNINRATDKNVMWHKISVSKLFDKLKTDSNITSVLNIKSILFFGWALWLHDTGKFYTRKEIKDAKGIVIDVTFTNHQIASAEITKKIFNRLMLPLGENELGYTLFLIENHERIKISELVTDSAIRRQGVDFGKHFTDMMFFGCCDQSTTKPEKQIKIISRYLTIYQRYLTISESDRIRYFKIPVKGDDIIRIYNPDDKKIIGKILTEIKNDYISGKIEFEEFFSHMENLAENKYNLKKI